MKLRITRNNLQIIPDRGLFGEDGRDEAYIEEVLGLKKAGDSIQLVRIDASGLSCLAYLETKRDNSGT